MSKNRNKKNTVFSKGSKTENNHNPSVQPGIEKISEQAAFFKEFGLNIPTQTVPIPSKGLVYPQESGLFQCETVDIHSMTTREEDILTSQVLLKKGTVITELIKSCLIEKFNPKMMLTGDRNALMVAIRITGYGNLYEAKVKCSECGHEEPQEFNLSELPIKPLTIQPVLLGENTFEYTLPYSKVKVRFKFLTGQDEEEIVATNEKKKKLGLKSDTLVTTNLLHSIVSVNGIVDRAKIAQFVRMMPARDSLSLRNYIRNNEPGLEMKQSVECSECGHVEEVGMPMGINFLWPQAGA